MGALLAALNRYGCVHLRQRNAATGPVESLLLLGSRFGDPHFHKLSDEHGIHPIRHIPGYPEYANANVGDLGLHTDGSFERHPPVYMLMYCERPASVGGASRLAAGDALYWHLHDHHPKFLSALSLPAAFTIARDDRSAQRSVFTRDGDAVKIAFRDGTDVRIEVHPAAREAFQYVRKWLADRSHYIEFALQPGDVLIFDNTRMLHGRTAFLPDSGRLYHGLWCKGGGAYGHLLRSGIDARRDRTSEP